MNQILDLLINYWKPIVGLLFTVAGFIVALIKKKPLNDILTDIYEWSVLAINDTEVFSKMVNIHSSSKLSRAVEYVLNCIHDKYPTINEKRYKNIVMAIIEKLLSTPQKHNEGK